MRSRSESRIESEIIHINQMNIANQPTRIAPPTNRRNRGYRFSRNILSGRERAVDPSCPKIEELKEGIQLEKEEDSMENISLTGEAEIADKIGLMIVPRPSRQNFLKPKRGSMKLISSQVIEKEDNIKPRFRNFFEKLKLRFQINRLKKENEIYVINLRRMEAQLKLSNEEKMFARKDFEEKLRFLKEAIDRQEEKYREEIHKLNEKIIDLTIDLERYQQSCKQFIISQSSALTNFQFLYNAETILYSLGSEETETSSQPEFLRQFM